MLYATNHVSPAGHLVSIVIIVGSLAVWFGAYGLALLATRPDMPDPRPATSDLGSEPPAVVSLLVNRWEVTEDAAESTLLDLAARHILEFRQPGNDPMQTTVHIRQSNPTGLSRYEQRIFDRVSAVAVGGVVPLTALTFRDKGQAAAWAKQLSAEVVADARTHGLSQRRMGPALVTALVALAGAAAAGLAVGVLLWLEQEHDRKIAEPTFWTGIIAWFILTAIASRSHGERDTPAGREVASRWLGVRAWLRGHEAFADLPPAAVAVWDRYLSYGTAVGATRVASAVIDLGMGNRRNVWSSYRPGGEGTWHRVRVHYPRFWPRYGKTAPKLLLKAVIIGAVGYLLVRYWYRVIGTADTTSTVQHSAAAPYLTLIKSAGVLIGLAGLAYLVYVVVRTTIDLAAPRTITGEVVWTENWRSTGDETKVVVIDYLAVDDGTADHTRAWALPNGIGAGCAASDIVTFTVRPWSRRVTRLTVQQRGNASRFSSYAPGTTERLIETAMGIPTPRGGIAGLTGIGLPGNNLTGIRTGDAGALLNADEVGTALGTSVTLQASAKPNPIMSATVFRAPDGSDALTITRTGGTVAHIAMRARPGQSISGLGDEARGGPGWLAVRRADYVVLLQLGGPAAQSTPPQTLMDLAHTAIGRLPGTTSVA